MTDKQEFFETPEEIVKAYYNGELEKNYPILTKAIVKILKRELAEFTEALPDQYRMKKDEQDERHPHRSDEIN